jgi:uncharacterized protein
MNNPQPGERLVAGSPARGGQWHVQVALALIAAYRALLSPVLFSLWGPACRFEPTCSAYAAQAIARYGIAMGGWIAMKRLLKCRPLGEWGFDPLPETIVQTGIDNNRLQPCLDKRNIVG